LVWLPRWGCDGMITSSQKLLMARSGAGGAGADPWDISAASFVRSFSILSQDDIATGIFFKPDGTKMYVTGDRNNLVYEYDLSTAWDISTASYLQSGTAGSTNPFGLYFSPDGTKMYTINYLSDVVYERHLSTAWDVTASTLNSSIDVSAYENIPCDVYLKPDGTKMYVVGYGSDEVNEFDLSTAWDLSTASYVQEISIATQDTIPFGLFFKPDGTKMYIAGNVNKNIFEYSLSTAWDLSTASYSQSFSVASQDNTIRGLYFKPDGTGFYTVGQQYDSVYQYDIG